MKKLTEKEVKEILELYKDKNIKLKDIAERYGIGPTNISNLARKNHIEPRKVINKKKSSSKIVCSKCRWEFKLPVRPKFCPYCGSDIRNEPQIMIDKLSDVWRFIATNSDVRTEKEKAYQEQCRKDVNDIKKFIENLKV